jgi:digeranylgeranylglycerophospholipid reductase
VEAFDIVVVGAGPAGSVAARAAAEHGAKTLLVDQRPELGHPVQCGEFLPTREELADIFPAAEDLELAYRIPPSTVLRATRRLDCIAPDGQRYPCPLSGFIVSRRAFDKALALEAEGAGAELRFPMGVTRVHDGLVEFAAHPPVRARVVIGADGPLSTVARSAGFELPRELYRMITATSEAPGDDSIALYFGRVAPGGYAWAFPRAHDLNVGLGVTRIPPGESLSSLLDRFLKREGLPPATERTRWWVPIGAPARRAVRGRSMLAGDAANLVMATNGGGIPTAMISGYDAGLVAAQHVRHGASLEEYDRRLSRRLATPLARAHRIKRLADQVARWDPLLGVGMGYIGASGLDAMMRLRWPHRLGGLA